MTDQSKMTIDSTDAHMAQSIAEHRGIVVRVARSFADRPADQDDLIQEILLKIWAARASFRGEAKPSTWMYRIALNQAVTWQRGESKRRDRQRALIEVADTAAGSSAEDGQRLDELYQLIRALNPVDRSLVVLSLDGFSYREIAEVVGLSESNVGARLSRARTRLQAERSRQIEGET